MQPPWGQDPAYAEDDGSASSVWRTILNGVALVALAIAVAFLAYMLVSGLRT